MYLLELLREQQAQPIGVTVEYRLACSGELYRANVQTSDWRKSDATRALLEEPFQLRVASQPFDSYPQELCLRFTLQPVTEEGGGSVRSSRTFLPDAAIVEDLCSVLSLLSRRLITCVTKTREGHGNNDVPLPILDRLKVVAWRRRAATITTSLSGQFFHLNDPPPVCVNSQALRQFLVDLPNSPYAEKVVHAARLYKSALELIEDRPDTAYLALITVIETLADVALPNYEPTLDEKLAIKGSLVKHARSLGLDEAQVKELVLAACKGDRWLSRRFTKFCLDNCSPLDRAQPDRVYLVPAHLNPPDAETEKTLKKIYRARSTNLHVALPFPPGIGIGTSPQIKIADLPLDPLGRPDIPPAPWFERIVAIAATRFLIPGGIAPFAEHCA